MKRFITVVLCCVLCLSFVSVSSFAVDDLKQPLPSAPIFSFKDGETSVGLLRTLSMSQKYKDYFTAWFNSDRSLLTFDGTYLCLYIFGTVNNCSFTYGYFNGSNTLFFSPDNSSGNFSYSVLFFNASDGSALAGYSPNIDGTSFYSNRKIVLGHILSGSFPAQFDKEIPPQGFIDYGNSLTIYDDGDLAPPPPLPVISRNLTINYQYEDGSIALPAYTQAFTVGDSYNVSSPAIDGYTPDVDTVSGTMSDSDITVTVTYRKTVPDPVLYDLTIDYLYGNGAPASVTYNAQFPAGDSYDVQSPLISGYTPDRARVVGVMPEEDVTETVIYTEYKPPPVDPTLPDVDPEYVSFNLPALYEMFATIRTNAGNIFSVGIWCFSIFLSVILVSRIANYFTR